MNENKVSLVISFILCTILFFIEILYLIFFNINKGIKKEEILNYINNIDIKEILRTNEVYEEIQKEIDLDKETIDKIATSPKIKTYIIDTTSKLYLGLFYEEPLPNITSNEIINLVNTNIDDIMKENNIENYEQQKQKILELTNKIALDIEENITNIESTKTNLISFKNIITKTIPNILLIVLLITVGIIFLINKNCYDYLLWTGLPTLISGLLFLILALSLTGTINIIEISDSIYTLLNKSFPNIIKILKHSSIITCIIGLSELVIYKIFKNQKQKGSVI